MAINCIYIDIESNYKIVKERNQTIMKNKMMLLTLACTLALTSLVGCGKNEPDKEETVSESTDDAQDVEDVLNGGWADAEEEEEDNSSITRPTHYDVLPEVANATIADGGVYQFADIVLYDGCRMSVDDVKEAVANSQTGAVCVERSDGSGAIDIYDEYELSVIGTMEWKYIDPNEAGALPVPEAGVYLYYVSPSVYANETFGITDSVYAGGGYKQNERQSYYSDTKTKDDIIAELESLGCEKVEDFPSSMTADDKGYYIDKGKEIDFLVRDNYWTGKTATDGSIVVYPCIGDFHFDDNNICDNVSNYYSSVHSNR